MQPQAVRNALQMRPQETRGSQYGSQAPNARMSAPPPPRTTQQVVEQAVVAAGRASGFGASALHDERVLDIPAYLRRGNNHHE
jgi:hypothetical protein